MTLSLATLQARPIEVEVFDNFGNSLAKVPLMTLSYTQWHNATLMVAPPAKFKRMELGQEKVDVSNTPEYRQKMIEYVEEINLRRLVMALVGGGGFTELDKLDVDAQVEAVRNLDVGIMNGLNKFLQGVALRTSADVFRPKSVSGTGDENLPEDEVDADSVDDSSAD